ncbi:2262_t:CDS:2, partial [Gigaspora margarita]
YADSNQSMSEFINLTDELTESNIEDESQEIDHNDFSSRDDNNYEVYIKDHIQKSNMIKPAHLECTCPDFKFRGIACKHIFAVCQKFYSAPISHAIFAQKEKEPKRIPDTKFEDWIGAVQRVWDRYKQADRNRITGADLETIVDAEVRKKLNISLYDEYKIPEYEEDKTYGYITKQRR